MKVGSQRILRPAKITFMLSTTLVALAFNMLPWPDVRWVPDLMALVLVFWCIHQPRKMGMGLAFVLGLLMDVVNGTLIGQHALAYTLLAFGGYAVHRRILWFTQWQQSLHVLVLLLLAQTVMLAVRMIAGGTFPGLLIYFGSFVSAALWPVVTFLLLAPQRMPDSVDENRPL
ncbi:MAG TPA: rod shape-determining protein MreD [Burkholderiales bacterium]|jgi:rod shape-determining protein MreD|nr:rod shape-determining protein MreD [Burkholderiales bacterium]